MKVLLITKFIPLPIDSGAKARLWDNLKALSKYHNITLVGFFNTGGGIDHHPVLENYCESVIALPAQGKLRRWLKAFLITLLSEKPFTVGNFFSVRMRRTIDGLIDKESFDLIHVDHLQMAQYVSSRVSSPMILESHNLEWELFWRYGENSKNIIKRIFGHWQARKLKNYELNTYRRFNKIIVVTATIAGKLTELGVAKGQIHIIPTCASLGYFQPSKGPVEENTVMMCGLFSWPPNADSLLWFIKKIMPGLSMLIPEIKLYVVGRCPRSVRKNIGGIPGIVMTGFVPDIRTYLKRCSVLVVPLRIGSGIRTKIIHAMAMGKAVVATPLACEGLEVRPGRDVVLASSPPEFIAAVADLLRSPIKRRALGVNALKCVRNHYNSEILEGKFLAVYHDALSASGRSGCL